MILYLVHDTEANTYSYPLVGPDLQTINQSLQTLNPENLKNLKVIKLDTINTPSDLLNIRVLKTNNKIRKLKSLFTPELSSPTI